MTLNEHALQPHVAAILMIDLPRRLASGTHISSREFMGESFKYHITQELINSRACWSLRKIKNLFRHRRRQVCWFIAIRLDPPFHCSLLTPHRKQNVNMEKKFSLHPWTPVKRMITQIATLSFKNYFPKGDALERTRNFICHPHTRSRCCFILKSLKTHSRRKKNLITRSFLLRL